MHNRQHGRKLNFSLARINGCLYKQPMFTNAEFVAQIEDYLQRSRMAPTTFGAKAVEDPSFVWDLRNKGRSPRLLTVERVLQFMRDNP